MSSNHEGQIIPARPDSETLCPKPQTQLQITNVAEVDTERTQERRDGSSRRGSENEADGKEGCQNVEGKAAVATTKAEGPGVEMEADTKEQGLARTGRRAEQQGLEHQGKAVRHKKH